MITVFIVIAVALGLGASHLIAFARGIAHGRKKLQALHDWHREVGHV